MVDSPYLSFLDELKRRNVIRIAGLYLVGAWLIVQVASTVLPAFEGPGWVAERAVVSSREPSYKKGQQLPLAHGPSSSIPA